MIRVYGVFYLLLFLFWLVCLIDAITARADEVRHLPKTLWVVIVLFFSVVGSICWLVAGRPQHAPRKLQPWEREQPAFPEYDRPGRAAAPDPRRDAEFLEQLRARAEEQRRAYREQKAREQRDPRRDADGTGSTGR